MITPGTLLGRDGGRVQSISTNRIVFRHFDEGVDEVRDTVLRLYDTTDLSPYRSSVIRHDLEEDERDRRAVKEGLMDGLEVERLLHDDGRVRGPRTAR